MVGEKEKTEWEIVEGALWNINWIIPISHTYRPTSCYKEKTKRKKKHKYRIECILQILPSQDYLLV